MLNKKYAADKTMQNNSSNIVWGPIVRFHKGALDPTMTWESLDKLEEYVSNPNENHYDGQIVSVGGRLYLLRESGTTIKDKIIEIAFKGETDKELAAVKAELIAKADELQKLSDNHDKLLESLQEKQTKQEEINAAADEKLSALKAQNEKDISDINKQLEALSDEFKLKQTELSTLVVGLKERLDRADDSITEINKDVAANDAKIDSAKEDINKIEAKLNNVATINGKSIFDGGNIELLARLDADEIKKLIDSGALNLDAGFATDKELAAVKAELIAEIQKKQNEFDHSGLATKEELEQKVDKNDIATVAPLPGKIAGYDENGNLHTSKIQDVHKTTDSTLVPTLQDVNELIKYNIDHAEHPFSKDSFKTIDGQSILVGEDGITDIQTKSNIDANVELPSENYSNPLSSVKIAGDIYTIPRVIADATNNEGTIITDGSTLQNIKIDNRVYSLPNKTNITQDILNDSTTITNISEKVQQFTPTDTELEKITQNSVGGLASGTDLEGKTLSDILQEILIGGNKPLFDALIYYGVDECDPENDDDLSNLTDDDILAGKTTNAYEETDLEELAPVNQSIFIAIPTEVSNGVKVESYSIDKIENTNGMDVIGMFYTESRTLNGINYKIFISDKRSIASKYKIQISKKGG